MTLPIHYKRIPEGDGDVKQVSGSPERPVKCAYRKKTFLHLLAATVILFSVMYGLRHISRAGLIYRGRPCYKGLHGSAAKLPSHYTLPSGDKIPSVALGMSTYGTFDLRCEPIRI